MECAGGLELAVFAEALCLVDGHALSDVDGLQLAAHRLPRPGGFQIADIGIQRHAAPAGGGGGHARQLIHQRIVHAAVDDVEGIAVFLFRHDMPLGGAAVQMVIHDLQLIGKPAGLTCPLHDPAAKHLLFLFCHSSSS